MAFASGAVRWISRSLPAPRQIVPNKNIRSSVRISASRVRSSASNDPLIPRAASRHEDRHSGGFLPPIRHQLG